MKQQTFIARLLMPLAILSITLSSCDNRRKIALDEKRASEQVIPISQAMELQNNFISRRDELSQMIGDTAFLSQKFNLSNAEAFNRDAIALLLNQADADGIRIYFGNDASGKVRLVLLPVDKSGGDIITTLISNNNGINFPGVPSAQAAPPANAQAVETGQICPTCKIK